MIGLKVHFETETTHRLFNVDTYSAELQGSFMSNTSLRSEFYELIKNI